MANWQGMILTDKGRALQAKVEAGTTLLKLIKIKLGDGTIGENQTLEGLTDIVGAKQIIGITTLDPQPTGICKITGTVTNIGLEVGYNIKMLGIFATDPDVGEILYAVTTDSNFDYLQAEGGATIVSEEFNLSISISNTGQVIANIDATGLLTVSSAKVLINQLIAAHNESDSAHENLFAKYVKKAGDTITDFLHLGKADDNTTNAIPPDDDNSDKVPSTSWVQKFITKAVFALIAALAETDETGVSSSGSFLGVNWLIAQNGYISFGKLFGGFILQWGATTSNKTAVFPVPFTQVPFSIVCTEGYGASAGSANSVKSATNLNAYFVGAQTVSLRYIALGL